MTFSLHQFDIGPMQNFGYIIADEKTKRALIVDPAWSPKKLVNMAEEKGYTLAGLAITHAHYDHVNAIEEILRYRDIPVYAQKPEIDYAKSGASVVGSLGKTVVGLDPDATLELGETQIRFFHTPGHTPGSQCLQVGNHLLTGDTLFIGGCGRSDLPGGNPAQLFGTLRRLAKLPGELEICPGHNYGEVPRRTLENELKVNPYLRVQDEKTFLEAVSK